MLWDSEEGENTGWWSGGELESPSWERWCLKDKLRDEGQGMCCSICQAACLSSLVLTVLASLTKRKKGAASLTEELLCGWWTLSGMVKSLEFGVKTGPSSATH